VVGLVLLLPLPCLLVALLLMMMVVVVVVQPVELSLL
jgi:hypothetical protein